METERLFQTTDAKIGRLIVLPWEKAIEIAVKSIRVRFWRSMITMSSIILAIAFLMSIWTSTCIVVRLTELATDERPALRAVLIKSGVDMEQETGAVTTYGTSSYFGALAKLVTSIRTRDKWLIVLSLLVCVVGIVNAMLMSVTERFREIGTMKCLGALDRFIVRLFLLESSGLGVIGTVIGIVVGFLLTMFRVTITYGFYPWKYFPVTLVFQSAVISLIVGTVLSVLAAIYPAWTAAKMEPVAAMRIDA
jgi:hypothetical protein